MRSALLDSYAADYDLDQGPFPFRHFVLSYVKDTEKPDENSFKTKESLITWTKYCERFMMFKGENIACIDFWCDRFILIMFRFNHKALRGHCQIPQDYPDTALLQWLSKQREELHLHSKRPLGELPVPLKLLVSLGLKGEKRDLRPTMSSRTLKRKFPSKLKSKRRKE